MGQNAQETFTIENYYKAKWEYEFINLYPDLEKSKKDEQRRFEILLAHWDV